MDIYNKKLVKEAIFVKRLNRFVATVKIDGQYTDVHVKNTGRCQELFVEGRVCYLLESKNDKRKYKYDLIAIYKEELLINIDSQVPNKVVEYHINNGDLFENVMIVRREVTYQDSRFDLYMERKNGECTEKIFIEVKGVTLFEGDRGIFPDAPTERGTKHLRELIDAKKEGYRAIAFFLIQAKGIKSFSANMDRDPKFAQMLTRAKNEGVEIMCYNCDVKPYDIKINDVVRFQ